MNPDEDPGWRPALRPWWRVLIPWFAFWWRRRPDLVGLRRLYVHMAVALVEVTLIVPCVFENPESEARWPWVVLGIGSGAAVAGLIWSSRSRWRAPPDANESVAQAFRSLMFIRLGLATSPALYGIAGSEISGEPSIAFVGTAVSLALLASFGPTRSRVDEVQERLRQLGFAISLRAALNEAP